MKKHVWSGFAVLAALALAGCGKSTSSLQANAGGAAPVGSDQAQVATVVQNNPEFVDESVWQSSLQQPYDNPGFFGATRPLRFWREITSVDRTVDTQFGPPDSTGRPALALVTVHKHIVGTFNVRAAADSSDSVHALVKKPLDDDWTRKLMLVRVNTPSDSGRWRLAGTSGVDVRTRGGSTRIQSVRIQSGPLDTLITDPLEMHMLRRIVVMRPAQPVTVTVTTGNATDVVLFYGADMRRRFTNNNNGTFTFVFPAGRFIGLRHFGVDALSNGTLFDTQAAYDSNAWLFPYTVDPRRGPVDGR